MIELQQPSLSTRKASGVLSVGAPCSASLAYSGRLFLISPTLFGFEMEIARFRSVCSHVSVQTNARTVLDFCDGEQPVCAVLLVPSVRSTSELPISRVASSGRMSSGKKGFTIDSASVSASALTADVLLELSREIQVRSLPVSLAVYMRRPTVEELSLFFRSGASDYFSLSGSNDSWDTILTRLWARWEGLLPALTLRRNLESAFNRLSPPLQDTAKMLYMGCTNQEIARASDRKLRTVEQRRAQIMTALQANNYAELIRYLGLVLEHNGPC